MDKARIVRREEYHRLRDLIRMAETAEWEMRREVTQEIALQLGRERLNSR